MFQRLTEAESAFSKLLTLNSYCEEAEKRISSIRIKQLVEMGFDRNQAFTAVTRSQMITVSSML